MIDDSTTEPRIQSPTTPSKCPYCAKVIDWIEAGEHRCTRCSGVFSLNPAGQTIKIRRSKGWLIAMYCGCAAEAILAGIIALMGGLTDIGSPQVRIPMALFFGAFSLMFIFGIIHALRTGELPLGKRSDYREDGAIGFYFCLVIAAIAAILGLAVAVRVGLSFGE